MRINVILAFMTPPPGFCQCGKYVSGIACLFAAVAVAALAAFIITLIEGA
jgi:hypothetical protein